MLSRDEGPLEGCQRLQMMGIGLANARLLPSMGALIKCAPSPVWILPETQRCHLSCRRRAMDWLPTACLGRTMVLRSQLPGQAASSAVQRLRGLGQKGAAM